MKRVDIQLGLLYHVLAEQEVLLNFMDKSTKFCGTFSAHSTVFSRGSIQNST